MFDMSKFESAALFQSLVHNGTGITLKEFEGPIEFRLYPLRNILGMVGLASKIGARYSCLLPSLCKKDRTLYKMTIEKRTLTKYCSGQAAA